MIKSLIVSCLLAALQFTITHQQHQDYTTPVPILKQIDRQNNDGSYTFGYEAADKSFKIETKYPNGEVYGKYGYIDDQGKLREIEYGATKRGFEPAGSDINVPPPTLTNKDPYPLGPNEVDDGQYREDPSIYYKDEKFNRPIAASKFSLNNFQPQQNYYNQAPQPQPQFQHQPQHQHQPQSHFFNQQPIVPAPVVQPRFQQPVYQQPQQPYYQPQTYHQPQQPQPQYNPYNPNSLPNHFHPAVKSLDIWSGSYSLDYTGRK